MTPRELAPLFQPLTIRSTRLRNRFVMPGMQRGFMNDGAPTPTMVDYMRRCAAGSAGLIISESTSPDHPSAYWQPMMGRLEPGTLQAWKNVVTVVRGEGAVFFQQIWHPGAMRKVAPGHPLAHYPAWSPSGLIQSGRVNGHAMTRQDLDELKRAYVRAAENAQMLGADGKEVDYGATVASGPEDLRAMLAALRAAGVDMFNVSSRRFLKREWPDSEHPDLTIAEWTKRLTDAAVMTCGSVGLNVEMFANLFEDQEPSELSIERDLRALAERVQAGTLDLVGIGRMHIANNDFVNKVRERRFHELALFNKSIHLAAAMAAVEPGFVEAGRKNATAE